MAGIVIKRTLTTTTHITGIAPLARPAANIMATGHTAKHVANTITTTLTVHTVKRAASITNMGHIPLAKHARNTDITTAKTPARSVNGASVRKTGTIGIGPQGTSPTDVTRR
jgi:hypothetical protein